MDEYDDFGNYIGNRQQDLSEVAELGAEQIPAVGRGNSTSDEDRNSAAGASSGSKGEEEEEREFVRRARPMADDAVATMDDGAGTGLPPLPTATALATVVSEKPTIGRLLPLRPETGSTSSPLDVLSSSVSLQKDVYLRRVAAALPADAELVLHEADAQSRTAAVFVAAAPSTDASRQPSADSNLSLPSPTFPLEYLIHSLGIPVRSRNVAMVGALQQGKSSLVEHFLLKTHPSLQPRNKLPCRSLLDSCGLPMEVDRDMTLKMRPVSLMLQSEKGTSYAVTFLDTPGHADFLDETACALRLVDGAVVVVDAAEGPVMVTRLLVQECVRQRIPMVLVFTKMDRLVLELHLLPGDAYLKLRTIVEELNGWILQASPGFPLFRPGAGNVCFSSMKLGYIFSLPQFAAMYVSRQPHRLRIATAASADPSEIASRLWGSFFLDRAKGQIVGDAEGGTLAAAGLTRQPTFVELVLQPLYDLCECVLSLEGKQLQDALALSQIRLRTEETGLDYWPLLRTVFQRFIPEDWGFVLALVSFLPSASISQAQSPAWSQRSGILSASEAMDAAAAAAAAAAVSTDLQGQQLRNAILACSADGPLLLWVGKMYLDPATGQMQCLAKVLSGQVRVGSALRRVKTAWRGVRSGSTLPSDDAAFFSASEDVFLLDSLRRRVAGLAASDPPRWSGAAWAATNNSSSSGGGDQPTEVAVASLFIFQSLYRIPVASAVAGQLVLLGGIDALLADGCGHLLFGAGDLNGDGLSAAASGSALYLVPPVQFLSKATVRVPVQPKNAKDLPRLLRGLRRARQLYPACEVGREESGELFVLGTGELYMDALLGDLRQSLAPGVEINTAPPLVVFREAVRGMSAAQCTAESSNRKVKFWVICEPLEPVLSQLLDKQSSSMSSGGSSAEDPVAAVSAHRLKREFGWSSYDARRLWCLGRAAALIDDTLPEESDPTFLQAPAVKEQIHRGFQWACAEGPMSGEPLYGIKARIVRASLLPDVLASAGAMSQIPSLVRRCLHAAVLTADPCILEPVYAMECILYDEFIPMVERSLGKRRGRVSGRKPVAGTALTVLHGFIPVLESFGFEIEIRAKARGLIVPQFQVHHWEEVPGGNPLLDREYVVRPLERAPVEHLARDAMVKLRRRKGLAGEDVVPLVRYFDPEPLAELTSMGVL